MADKEATVYIVDVGKSMAETNHGRDESDLDWCMQYVWDKITTTVATGRKTMFVGVVGLRTDKTHNEMEGEEAYDHISVLQPLEQILMPQIRSLREQIKPSKTEKGDAISALVIAIQMIAAHCRHLKYKRRIILVTNGKGVLDTEDLKSIALKIRQDSIDLVIIGSDFDDAEYGFKEENKPRTKLENERILQSLADDCGGVYGTMAQAIEEMAIPRVKPVKPTPSYKGILTLGDPEKYDTALSIHVDRYPRIMQAKPPSASSFVVRADLAPGESQAPSATATDGECLPDQDDLTAVKNSRTYHVLDPDAPEGKRDVDLEDLAKGYEYGRTAVHMGESEYNTITKFESPACMDIIGFVPADKFERYMEMSRTNIIIPQKTNEKAAMALSSFIHALFELETYAVARFVAKDDKDPLILLLAPSIETDYECLIDTELPFAEDMRGYRFPPLDRIVTVGGKTLHQHRNLPSDELTQAMSDYVDNMDLSTLGKDDEGNPAEYAPLGDTYSPVLHRVNQAIRHRAVNPDSPIPSAPEILTQYSQAPTALLQRAQQQLDALSRAADVKRVPPRQKGLKRTREFEKPLSGLNVEELLGRQKRTKLSAANAVPEFKQAMRAAGDVAATREVARQLGAIIEGYVRHSVGDSGYGRAIEALRVLKEECLELEEPALYNEFLKQLKEKLLKGDLGGERRELWWLVRVNRLGLIEKRLCGVSKVTEEEAREFLKSK
ncbi:uncharacterized protein K452DRAFT_310629 [Aplosporella prunicola CBS 121167]|uniref:ATP-dependent DNA helicase II subunit 2 n=1 Tax=Aplosporella prunicola CBS 121167 TaxID=1176127 RepID=A0A6A6B856_9PEZI|nr:uncharacterized protein K452DRAFT_310629 [Aplosporella prunicola CBS 121167]KAF2139738.1 hypothetical protein K452DRAFT_310629 [Aplosporella prunicola CBS 121167]